jgi:cell wall-associated NlpC family hydrolase
MSQYFGLTPPGHSPILRAMSNRPTLARTLRSLVAAIAMAGAMGATFGAPELSTDPVSRFLAEKGLVDPNSVPVEPVESDFVREVRDRASDMVLNAMNFLGVPYRRGGTSAEDGFDCSGFTRRVFEMSLGLVLPRRADEQASAKGLINVKRDELKPGDLVFFNTLKRTFSHVGIYVGEGKFIHAPRTGGEVRVEDMRFAYWSKRFTGARRPEPAEPVTTTPAEPKTLAVVQPTR